MIYPQVPPLTDPMQDSTLVPVIPTAPPVGGFLTVGVTTILAGIIILVWLVRDAMRPRRFPPGPPGLPIIGNILELRGTSEQLCDKWSRRYGDIFSFRVGARWVVVLNYRDVIKDALLKQGVEFSGRPKVYSAEIVSDGYKDIVFSPDTDTWKLHRKLAHSALRQFATGKNLDGLVHSVLPQIGAYIDERRGQPLDPKLMLTLTLYNVLSRMCFAESYDFNHPKVLEYISFSKQFGEKIGFGLVADYFPWAKHIFTSGAKFIKEFRDMYLEWTIPQLKRHRDTFDPENMRDFCDLMLLAQKEAIEEKQANIGDLTDAHLVHTVNSIFIAGIETSMQRLYWCIALMVEYPDIQTKVQREIDGVIGRDRNPVIKDRGTLPYTEATLYETLRYSTVAPVGVPHAASQDTEFRGFLIPKDTVIIINHFSMHFDPREWAEPHSFRPEHFLNESGSVREHPPSFLPFGAGRRSCLGEAVAKADLFLIFAWLMQNYKFTKTPLMSGKSLLNLLPDSVAGRILRDYEVVVEKRER